MLRRTSEEIARSGSTKSRGQPAAPSSDTTPSSRPTPSARARRPRVALFIKRSSYRVYVEEKKDKRVKRLLAEGDPTVRRLRASHEEHERTVVEVKEALERLDAEVEIARHGVGVDVSGFDLVVTVGGDGTLLGASHSVVDVPVLAINSAPSHSVGFFCGAKSGGAFRAISSALRGTLKRAVLTRMKVCVNGKVVAANVLNDALFCHAVPAATSRYIIEFRGETEEQKSSGFWIGPPAGSTAAQRSAGGRVLPLSSHRLQLVVREPYTPHGEPYRFRRALIEPGEVLIVRSKTHEARIFFDGPERFAEIMRGDVMEFSQSSQSLTLLGISSRRRWGQSP
jgi:NAD+ kinase